jgi:WD40 repeat protein
MWTIPRRTSPYPWATSIRGGSLQTNVVHEALHPHSCVLSQVWAGETGQCTQTLPGFRLHVTGLAVLQNAEGSTRLVSGGQDLTGWRLWDPASGGVVHSVEWGARIMRMAAFVDEVDGRNRVVAGDDQGRVCIWDVGQACSRATDGLRPANKLG